MRKLRNDELNRLTVQDYIKTEKIPLVVVLDNIRSMNNIGSVFRTSDAFKVKKVILCGITATPPHPDIHKTALGATESVEWLYYEDTLQAISELRTNGYRILAVEQAEDSLKLNEVKFSTNDKLAIVLGHEVRGVQQEVVDVCDNVLEVKQFGTKHSLNISVCAGIVIWELAKKFLH